MIRTLLTAALTLMAATPALAQEPCKAEAENAAFDYIAQREDVGPNRLVSTLESLEDGLVTYFVDARTAANPIPYELLVELEVNGCAVVETKMAPEPWDDN